MSGHFDSDKAFTEKVEKDLKKRKYEDSCWDENAFVGGMDYDTDALVEDLNAGIRNSVRKKVLK